ncbi:putative MFS-type transporter [Verticillium dahliae VDG2]|nr:putative MFS-type transporter [Verticillium dahliae VDG2]
MSSSSSGRTTLVKPPPYDPEKSHIENVLEVTELGVLGPDIFTNTRQPWHPPGARGIFGGARSNRVDGLGDGPDDWAARPTLGMLVSLDHSIYFHDPRRVRADEWMFSEMDTPWAGDGRGVVLQRIFAADGTLLATCVQEGLVRLTQEDVDGAAREGGATAKDAGKAKL